MKDYYENLRDSNNRIRQWGVVNDSIISAIPAYKTAFATFVQACIETDLKEQTRISSTEGKTDKKHATEEALIRTNTKMAGCLCDMATETNNVELLKRVDRPVTFWTHLRDTNLVDETDLLLELENQHRVEMGNYGILDTHRQAHKDLRDEYVLSMGSQGLGESVRAGSNKELVLLFRKTRRIIKKRLDKLVYLIADDHSEAYYSYQEAKKVRNLGIRHRPAEPPAPPVNPPQPDNPQQPSEPQAGNGGQVQDNAPA